MKAKYKCVRCGIKGSLEEAEATKLGWRMMPASNQRAFAVCPRCVRSIKQFIEERKTK